MTQTAHISRSIVVRARRDTVALVTGAVTATFVLSYAIHARPDRTARVEETAVAAPQQDWAGGLAALAPSVAATVDPITSASLVVPKADLALPVTPVRPLVKLHGCEDSNCIAKAGTPIQARRVATIAETTHVARRTPARDKGSLMSSLNPLNHLPDMSIIRRPLVYAGNSFTSWFRRD